jgi:hypothetical protein
MVQNYPAKNKLWGSKVDEIGFLLVIPVQRTAVVTCHSLRLQVKNP